MNIRWSGKRDSNSRPSRWQRDALPLSYSRSHFIGIPAKRGGSKSRWSYRTVFPRSPPTGRRPTVHNRTVPTPDPLMREFEILMIEAGRIGLAARANLRRELKPDGSVVTNGDRDVQKYLEPRLTGLIPGAFWGEEGARSEPNEHGLWVVDPIDGTSNYAFGLPVWGVSAGLVQGESVRLGGVFLPELGRLYAVDAEGRATLNGKPMPPIPAGKVEPYELVGVGDTARRAAPRFPFPGKARQLGSFVVEACFVAEQSLRAMVGMREKLYDIAPSVGILRALGAEVRYLDGSPFSLAELVDGRPIDRPWIMAPRGSFDGLAERPKP